MAIRFTIFIFGLITFLGMTIIFVLYNLRPVGIDLYLYIALGVCVNIYILIYFIKQIF